MFYDLFKLCFYFLLCSFVPKGGVFYSRESEGLCSSVFCLNFSKVVTESSMVREERFEFCAGLSKEVPESKRFQVLRKTLWECWLCVIALLLAQLAVTVRHSLIICKRCSGCEDVSYENRR